MGSGYNLDPAKIGQVGYNLLKYYEQQLKALLVHKIVALFSYDFGTQVFLPPGTGFLRQNFPNIEEEFS